MKIKPSTRVLAAVMAFIMVMVLVPLRPMTSTAVANTYTLDASTLASFSAGAKADGTAEVSADGFFTLHWSAASSVADGKIDFGANGSATANCVEFTVPEGSTATAKITWVKKTDDAVLTLYKGDAVETQLANTVATAGSTVTSSWPKGSNTLSAGTYAIASADNGATIAKVEVTVDDGAAEEPVTTTAAPATTAASSGGSGKHVLDVGTMPDVAQNGKTDGQTEVFGGYFTVIYSAKNKIEGNSKNFDDGFAGTKRFSFGSNTKTDKGMQNSIMITTGGSATVKVWWVCGGDGRQVVVFNESGTSVAQSESTCTKNSLYISEFALSAAGTYYIGNAGGSNYFYKIEVTEGGSVTPPATTTAPVATTTEAPATTTEAPVTTTEAPATTTEAPVVTTEAPATTEEPGTDVPDDATDTDKIDIWDFGFETFDAEKYNNLITVQKANDNFYVNGSIGEAGVVNSGNTMGDWSIDGGDFAFVAGGKTNHRLRVNTAIEGLTAHSSGKYLTDDNGVTYNGFLYSNAGNTSAVQIQVKAKAGDILTFVHGSNGGSADVVFESPSGKKTLDTFTAGANSAHGEVSIFYCDVDGVYKFYYTSEKLVVARVTRQHTKEVPVTGNVTAPAELTGYSLVFTCNESGAVTEAPVSGGAYATNLREGYSYAVSLKDANGYVISDGKELSIAAGAASASLDVTVIAVDLVTVSGNITGLDEAAMAKLALSFQSDAIFVPELTITGTAYSVELEKGVAYTVVAEGINDYELTSAASVSYDADATADITFAAKPTYKVTIAPEGCTLADLASATFTFTNLDEEGYVYTFTGPDAIALRDGTYSVKVTDSGIYVQKLTSNLKVAGADVTKTIPFNGNVTEWDFRLEDYTGQTPYNGAEIVGGKRHGEQYGMMIKNGSVTIPVSGPCQVKVSVGYNWEISFPDGTIYSDNTNSGDIDLTYSYTGAAGTVTITAGNSFTSYIKKIEIISSVAYKDTLTVGASGCDYTTISDALDAVRAMDRTSSQRVTIEIQPGDYEEQLVIDVPNVTLKNASSSPSLALTNEGVGIASNAVRITHYYGHGYDYFSMDENCKWNADVLAVNKENGYASSTNPGSGTTRGSYWNATVTVLAGGFQAEGIIFENSFNQYISKKASEDVIVNNGGAKEGSTPRADLPLGSTAVQDKKYVERAAALAIGNNCEKVVFDNCKFIGRQDTLYGGTGSTVAFYDCSIYGACDYIFGGMTAVFAKCDLVFNTSEDGNDKGYITAPQTPAGKHGLLMYNCHITSTTPGVDTASKYTSKPGDFGRPWAADSGEAVFYCSIIDATCEHWYNSGASLISADGWNSGLSGQSALCGEYGTYEYAKDVDNSANRVSWAQVFATPELASGEPISVETWFGTWNPFEGKDMTIEVPTEKVDNKPVEEEPDEPGNPTTSGSHVLDATLDLTAFDKGAKADGDTELVNDYFTITYSAKNKVDGSSKEFEDGYTATQRLNFGGKTDVAKGMLNTVKFTTTNPASVKLWWVCGGDGRTFAIYDESGNILVQTEEAPTKDSLYISELTLDEAGTYYLGVPTGSNYLFKMQVTVDAAGAAPKPERADWAGVATPEVTGATTEDGKVKLTVKAEVGYDGADEVVVTMYDEEGNEIASKRSIAEKDEHTLTFEPTASGKYTFKATISREGEEDKTAAADYTYDYVLPLEAPVISSATSVGAGGIEVVWNAAQEAESYNVYVDGVLAGNTTDLKYTVTGLSVGTKYSFTVEAVRGEDKAMSEAMSATATENAQRVWSTTIYGPSTSTSTNGVVGDMNEDGVVTVYSEGGKGKLQYKDSDGLTYYYTAIPEDKNFTFRVKVHVDSWTYSNGQEGFGIMATDRVAPNGSATWWSNQYMAMMSKVEYKYDHDTGEIFHTDVAADVGVKYDLRLGVGTTAKLGITPDNLSKLESNDSATILSVANGVTYPLDISIANNNINGKYNTVGNCSEPNKLETAGYATIRETTDFILEIQRNNTGYFITYYDADGNILGQQKNYDPKALSQLDTENVYVGFFAARNARATFTIEELSTIDPSEDAPAEEIPVTYVTPTLSAVSANNATVPEYTLSLLSNVSGTVRIQMHETVIYEAMPIEAGVRLDIPVELPYLAEVDFRFWLTPDPEQDLGENVELSSTNTVAADHQVNYNVRFNDLDVIYVAGKYGHPKNFGTREYPLDLATALKNVKAGQTIIMLEGTYKLDKTMTIESSINGTADKPIRMIADPEASSRPVLDFKGIGGGLVASGDYWYFEGFDVTNSLNGKPGFHLTGSNCVIDNVNAYHNGNSGIQLSRAKGSDLPSEWPSNNLILNCTSYGNADAGYEDADGFAAKLTCGPGNVFDGCVAHHNADDGWDLYAKVDTGPIGAVTIRNCVAYSNGYLEDGTNAGNGNGFKMGGSNMPGAHKLINSYAFFNKAKGIDSNSGPNIIVENCTTYNNESYNVAFYTNINQDTDFQATGIISYKDDTVKSGYETYDNLKPRGNQDTSKYMGDTNYYWLANGSANTAGQTVTADDFVSTEFKGVERNADGTINLQGFLEKAADSDIPGGAVPGGTPSGEPDQDPDQPGETTPGETTPGGEVPGETTPGETTPGGGIGGDGGETTPGETTPEDTKPSDPSSPGTGDGFQANMWIALMLIAAFGLVVMAVGLRKRKI